MDTVTIRYWKKVVIISVTIFASDPLFLEDTRTLI